MARRMGRPGWQRSTGCSRSPAAGRSPAHNAEPKCDTAVVMSDMRLWPHGLALCSPAGRCAASCSAVVRQMGTSSYRNNSPAYGVFLPIGRNIYFGLLAAASGKTHAPVSSPSRKLPLRQSLSHWFRRAATVGVHCQLQGSVIGWAQDVPLRLSTWQLLRTQPKAASPHH